MCMENLAVPAGVICINLIENKSGGHSKDFPWIAVVEFWFRSATNCRQLPISLENWWALQGLNLRPLPCEGNALPLS